MDGVRAEILSCFSFFKNPTWDMVYCGMRPCMIWSTCLLFHTHSLDIGQGNFMFDFQAQCHTTHFDLYLVVDHKSERENQ